MRRYPALSEGERETPANLMLARKLRQKAEYARARDFPRTKSKGLTNIAGGTFVLDFRISSEVSDLTFNPVGTGDR